MPKLSSICNAFANNTRKIILYAALVTSCGLITISCKHIQSKQSTTGQDTVISEKIQPTDLFVISDKPNYDNFGTRRLPMPPQGLTGKTIELVADPKVYPDTVSQITVVLHNKNAGKITAGLDYYLEEYKNRKWSPLKLMDNYAFVSIGIPLEEGQSLEFLTSIFPDENHYTPGKYRVVKNNLFKFETEFTIDSTYHLQMTGGNHLGNAFEMIIPEIKSNPTQKIDTLKVLITNNSTNQELINADDFALDYHDGDNQYTLLAKEYSGFRKEIYPLKPGQSMVFKIPVMSTKYRFYSEIKQPFGPGKYTLIKWSKVELYAEFELKSPGDY